MSDCHVTCTKCGWKLDLGGRCGHCGRKHKFTVTTQSNDYLYIEPGEKSKIIMQQQEKIAELQKRIDELEAENEAFHSMSDLRRNRMSDDRWFKYPEAPRGEE